MMIPITKPYIGDEEKRLVLEALESGWIVQGPNTHSLEKKFGAFCGIPHALATTSCTTALHLALIAEGVGRGHDVLLPSFTFVATANAVEYTGATPILCDIELSTFNMDPKDVLQRIETGYTPSESGWRNRETGNLLKAIMPVHLFGLAADMSQINGIAKEYGLVVIEDAACGLGAKINGTHVGGFGNTACFSLHPRKAVTTGEGGIVTTASDDVAFQINALRNHGATVSDLQRHQKAGYLLPEYNMIGYNYRLTDIQGAVGNAQMDRVQVILEGRRKWAKRYTEKLRDVSWMTVPSIPKGYEHGYQSYVCLIDYREKGFTGVEEAHLWRNRLMADLEAKGIATRQGTHAVHTLGYYRNKYGHKESDFINSYIADRLSISLPLYVQMTKDEQDQVIGCLINA